MLGWAGLVPLGGLVGGVFIDVVGLPAVFVFGAGVALCLVLYARLDVPDDSGPIVLPERSLLDELQEWEDRLVDEWARAWQRMLDDFDEASTDEDARARTGRTEAIA